MDNRRLRLALHAEHKAKRQAVQAVKDELVALQRAVPKIAEKLKTAQHAVLTADKARKAAEGAASRVKEKLSHLNRQVCFIRAVPSECFMFDLVFMELLCRSSWTDR